MTGRSVDDVNYSQMRCKAVEAKLNTQYKLSMEELDQAMKREPKRIGWLKHNLIRAQQAWDRYRKKACQAIKTWLINGMLLMTYYYDCMKDRARTRISQFDTLSVQNKQSTPGGCHENDAT